MRAKDLEQYEQDQLNDLINKKPKQRQMNNQKLIKAILKVMDEVKGIDKSMTVGSGNYSYKGVSDQEVKKVIGNSMQKNGLVMIPININEETIVDQWTENYNGKDKRKQSIFTKVKTKYLLAHESGESIELSGYGHGIDSQDKASGKATTYALKYCLLYTFLVPTGKIDDADKEHSNNIEVPKSKPKLNKERFDEALKSIEKGEYTVEKLKETFTLNKTQQNQLNLIS